MSISRPAMTFKNPIRCAAPRLQTLAVLLATACAGCVSHGDRGSDSGRLAAAIGDGDIGYVASFLHQGGSPDCMVPALSLDESATYPAIHYAVLVNEVSIVRLLRSAGASVDVRNAQRQRAIDVAVATGKGDDILDALAKQESDQRPTDRTVAAVVEILWRCVGNNASMAGRASEMERLRVTVNGDAFDPLLQHMEPWPLLPVHLAGKQDASAVPVTITLDVKPPHECTFSIQYDDRPLSGYTASGRMFLLRGYWVCQVDRFMDH